VIPRVSERGVALIKSWERCRLEAYQDVKGVWTIGWGHTSGAGDPYVQEGMVITQERADQILESDLSKFENWVVSFITQRPTHGQFDAMVSLCYNIGPSNFHRSDVLRAFNEGDVQAAADDFLNHDTSAGKHLPGLKHRRQDERALFLS
jgi:lysozyme